MSQRFRFAPTSIVIGSHPLHATGHALGLTHAQRDRRRRSVIAYFGDGATSQGDVMEALEFAVLDQVPVVFFCQNNQYAISLRVDRQSAVPIVQRAEGFGMPAVQVDGNDVLACQAVTHAALQHARAGQGPIFIEALTYRMGPHTTSDDPTRYRDAAELEYWRARDPIDRVRDLPRIRDVMTRRPSRPSIAKPSSWARRCGRPALPSLNRTSRTGSTTSTPSRPMSCGPSRPSTSLGGSSTEVSHDRAQLVQGA